MSTHFEKFGNPVEDATEPFNFPLLQDDIDEGVSPNDVNAKDNFLGCVIAHAVTRVAGAHRVAILRTIAYVAFPGEEVTRRYWIDEKSRSVLERWDRGEHVEEGIQLRLLPPPVGRKIDSERKNRTRHGRAPHKKTNKDPLHGIVRNGNLIKWDSE